MSVEIAASPVRSRTLGIFGFWMFLALFVWVCAQVDVYLATGPLKWWGFAVIAALLALFSSPVLMLALSVKSRRLICVYGVSLLALLVMFALPWHPRKAFTHDLAAIKTGMTVAQVEQIMGRYLQGRGAKWGQREPLKYPVGIERALMRGKMTYRWNETDGRYDSDWGEITFYDGLVSKVEFMAD